MDIQVATARKQDKYARRIDELIDPVALGMKCDVWPSKEDFMRIWHTLSESDKRLVNAATSPACVTVGDLYKITLIKNLHQTVEGNSLYDHNVLRAICYVKLIRLPSDVARREYYETLLDLRRGPQLPYEDISKVLKTDRQHIQEMAQKISTDGDGKRDLYRELIAYGMQTKEHEQAEIVDGVEIRPAVYELANPLIVYRSLQELSKLDGSYREAGKEEADSLEGQADRIKRLTGDMNQKLTVEAGKRGGVAKFVTKEDLIEEDD